MINVLVTGKNGQLGKCIADVSKKFSQINFVFCDSQTLNITDVDSIEHIFKTSKFDFCINCAAFTDVENAEVLIDKADKVNRLGALNLSEACSKYSTALIHISTDFVFDGLKGTPYIEGDDTRPLNVYGMTKRNGELEIKKKLNQHFIIRTSWLYSKYGSNFLKTILTLSENRKEISVIDDQIGSPTYTMDLAQLILKIITLNSDNYGTYHFSNLNNTSWFNFACEIKKQWDLQINIKPIEAINFATKASRPQYSVLNSSKTVKVFDFTNNDWRVSLKECFKNFKT